MLYFKNFKNYDEFKELFGIRECGNGEKSRRNKILLQFMKSDFVKKLRNVPLHYFDESDKEWMINSFYILRTMADMRSFLKQLMGTENTPTVYWDEDKCRWDCYLMNGAYYFRSCKYAVLDDGICFDGDFKSIRYKNMESDHIFKMKAGKFLRHLLDENPIGSILPEQVKVHLCEDFAECWSAYAQSKVASNELHIGSELEDFEKIYDRSQYDGDFGSCMAGEGQYYFYYESVKAKAAWLENGDGKLVARCIVFPEVYDEDGKVWKLAERQYSRNGDNTLKRMLVDKLIAAGEIDGYKEVGVDCHSARAYVANDGSSLSEKHFSIKCWLDFDDTISYQDSFKYYDKDAGIAYNRSGDVQGECYDLATCDSRLEPQGCWSEYEQEYIPDREAEYAEGREDYFYSEDVRWCENTRTYEFREDCVRLCNGDFAYYGYDCEGYDGVGYCEECNEYYLTDDGCYSELLDEYFCCEDCKAAAEKRFIEENNEDGRYIYDDYNEEWVDTEDTEMIRILVWDYDRQCRRNGHTRRRTTNGCQLFKYKNNWYYGNLVWIDDNTMMPTEVYKRQIQAAV